MTVRNRGILVASALTLGFALLVSGCGADTPATPVVAKDSAYVALGDSYTSNPGPVNLADKTCLRSEQNYPHLLAAELNVSLTDMSCGAAKIADLTTPQKAGVAAQFDALSDKTKLVTVSIGGNDTGFSLIVQGGCLYLEKVRPRNGQSCEARTRTAVQRTFILFESSLTNAYRQIREKAPNARVIVVGYPQILGNSGSCAKYPADTGDIAYINELNTEVNDTVQAAARAAGFEYLDLSQASMDHGICSADPWIAGLPGVPGQAAPVHPFANEQRAVAALIKKLVGSRLNRSAAGV